MGIPGFYGRWLSNNVRYAIKYGIPKNISSLSLDLNGVIHDARKVVFQEDQKFPDPKLKAILDRMTPKEIENEIISQVQITILRLVQRFDPKHTLIIAVDGIAPGAKMQQQRGRREKAAMDVDFNPKFDRNAITPGTDFMIRLDNDLKKFIEVNRNQLPNKVIYSSHLVPGEGEHKIMDYYRAGEVLLNRDFVNGNRGYHVLYGLDADLIMLSLLSPINNIFLSRESVREVISISDVRNFLINNANRKIKIDRNPIDDFVIMMSLLGNDFLPHMPSLNDMENAINYMLGLYSENNFQFTYNQESKMEINWSNFAFFIQALAENEAIFLNYLSQLKYNFPSRIFEASIQNSKFNFDIYRQLYYQNAFGVRGSEELKIKLNQILNSYHPTDEDLIRRSSSRNSNIDLDSINLKDIYQMGIDYQRTIAWVYTYYRSGTSAINQDWVYPYYHTPLLIDLSFVLSERNQVFGYRAHYGMMKFNVLHQLVSVLPLRSSNLLPKEIRVLTESTSIISDLYPVKFIIELDGKRAAHEGIPIIPFSDRRRIYEVVNSIQFTNSKFNKYREATDNIYINHRHPKRF